MIPASIPSALMKSLKLKIENRCALFIIKLSTICTHIDFLNLNFKNAGASAPVGPKVKPSRGGAVSLIHRKFLQKVGDTMIFYDFEVSLMIGWLS